MFSCLLTYGRLSYMYAFLLYQSTITHYYPSTHGIMSSLVNKHTLLWLKLSELNWIKLRHTHGLWTSWHWTLTGRLHVAVWVIYLEFGVKFSLKVCCNEYNVYVFYMYTYSWFKYTIFWSFRWIIEKTKLFPVWQKMKT